MAETPTISILLPIRDAARTLEACLASLAGQSFGGWECLAVDDHSTDGTREILVSWAARDRRIRLLEAPNPGGIVVALETARASARAMLLARQDADDQSHPERLARQLEAMRADPGIAVLGCLTRHDGYRTEGMGRYFEWLAGCTDPGVCAREIWVESPIAHPTALIRASILERVGGYREMGWPEDYDLWLRVHRAGGRIRNLPERLYSWCDRPDRLSRRDPRYSAEAFLRCRLHHLRRYLSERSILRPLIVWGAGRDGGRLARAWEVEIGRGGPAGRSGPPGPPIAAFVDIDPRKIGRWRHGRPIFSFEAARARFPDAFYLAAVGTAGAREQIRSTLASAGQVEGQDFLCLH